MARYYFDVYDANGLAIDDQGFDLADIIAVQQEAALLLSDHSRSATEKVIGSVAEMAIGVRDDAGPVMRVSFRFDLLRTI